jgi:hypothetical protein
MAPENTVQLRARLSGNGDPKIQELADDSDHTHEKSNVLSRLRNSLMARGASQIFNEYLYSLTFDGLKGMV